MRKLLCFIAGITLLFGFGCGDEGDQSRLQPLTSNTVAPVPIAQDFQATPLALHILTSTTYITVTNSEESSDGSGFVCGAGLIATAYHVIDAAYNTSNVPTYIKVQAVLGGMLHTATAIVARDVGRDIAILRVPDYPAPPLPLANSNLVYIGQPVFVAGNPDGYMGSYSFGIVSGVRMNVGPLLRDRSIQITAPISAGSSGSPVCSEHGAVIGVVSLSDVDGNDLTFITPSNALASLLQSIAPPTEPAD